jgi:hypothetical protein
MKKALLIAVAGLSLISGAAGAARVKDWRDLKKAHDHLQQGINEMARARAANHYDMAGHGAKAEELAKQAEVELRAAIEAAKHE